MESRKYFLKENLTWWRKWRGSANLQNKKFFDASDYFVARGMSSNQNAHKNRACGMSPQAKIFFREVQEWQRRKKQRRR
jgi:hypothetical protein